MYHITGASMSLACTCLMLGLQPDNVLSGLPGSSKLSVGLLGVMIVPSAIARVVNSYRGRR